MSKLAKALISALPYAHLLGISSAKADDGDDDGAAKQRADESDEDYAKRMEEADEKEKEDDAKAAKAKAEEDDEKKKDDEAKAAKAAKAAEDDEGDKEKAARTAERARCAAIFAFSAAGVRPDVAAHLAFSTDMSSADAIAMLATVSAGGTAPRNLASRMAAQPPLDVGPNGAAAPAAGSAQGVAARIIAAGKARRGEA